MKTIQTLAIFTLLFLALAICAKLGDVGAEKKKQLENAPIPAHVHCPENFK